ncbi:MAG: hypothetical protein U0Q12_19755 [Vicinamibacterales bacterium]
MHMGGRTLVRPETSGAMTVSLLRRSVLALGLTLAPSWVHAQQGPIATPVLQAYVAMQEALAADDFSKARAQGKILASLVPAAVQPLAAAVAGAKDIRTLRVALKPFSAALVKFALPQGFAVAFCPMFDSNKGANWIQRAGPVANPYYGRAMLDCGTIDASPGSHMDHTPHYGGIFFMAPDAFHHVEGTYPAPGVLRLRVYDNFTKEMSAKAFKGRVVAKETFDEATKTYREIAAFPLEPSPDDTYLEARVGAVETPVELTAKIVLTDGGPEERFDFVFDGVTFEDKRGATGASTAPPSGPRLFADSVEAIPTTPARIVEEMGRRDGRIQELIAKGAFTEVFIPALEAKELALALETHMGELPDDRRARLSRAIRDVVRAAWLLDWYGDMGNRTQVTDANEILRPAIAEIAAAVGGR